MAGRPLILVSNDDGVHADGLRSLRRALLPLADVFVGYLMANPGIDPPLGLR